MVKFLKVRCSWRGGQAVAATMQAGAPTFDKFSSPSSSCARAPAAREGRHPLVRAVCRQEGGDRQEC